MRSVCLAALVLALPILSARAQAVRGFYLQGNTGIVFPKTQPLETTVAPPVATEIPGVAAQTDAAVNGGPSLSETGSLGYGFGRGLRVEVQGIHLSASPTGG